MDPPMYNAFSVGKNRRHARCFAVRRTPGKEDLPLLSRKLWLPLFFGALLCAGSASALSQTFTLIAGSTMTTVNGGGTHVVAVTGSLTLNDDGVGNVTLTDLSLSHVAYEVGLPPFKIGRASCRERG